MAKAASEASGDQPPPGAGSQMDAEPARNPGPGSAESGKWQHLSSGCWFGPEFGAGFDFQGLTQAVQTRAGKLMTLNWKLSNS